MKKTKKKTKSKPKKVKQSSESIVLQAFVLGMMAEATIQKFLRR